MGEDSRIPKHLEPLLDGTPLAVEGIRASVAGASMGDPAYALGWLRRTSVKKVVPSNGRTTETV